MSLLVLLLALAVLGVVGAVAAGLITGGLAPVEHDRASTALPPGRLGEQDVARVRFSVGLRGYRMEEVDAALDRLREELALREELGDGPAHPASESARPATAEAAHQPTVQGA